MSDEATIWHGPEALRSFLLPIDAMRQHPRNARRGDVVLVAESLERYGQTRPIVLWQPEDDSGTVIVAGNHTWQAARTLGWTHIAGLADPGMDEEAALDFLLVDNATADKATYDDVALIATLQRLYDAGRLQGSGFTPDDLDDLIASANMIGEAARQEFQGGFAETPEQEAERAARAGQQGAVKQLPLSYPTVEFEGMTQKIGTLAKEYGTSGVTATIVEAVSRVFDEVWGEK